MFRGDCILYNVNGVPSSPQSEGWTLTACWLRKATTKSFIALNIVGAGLGEMREEAGGTKAGRPRKD